MAEKRHSSVGASSATRWWNCPGSVALSASVPKQPPSSYAEEGTAAHELSERAIKERKDPYDLVGEFAENGWEFTEEMAEHVTVYLEAILSDLKKYGLTWENVEVERHFTLSHIDKDAYGTNDANIGVFMKRLIVYDFKYGSGVPVEVVNNKQMLYYGVGGAFEGDYTEVELVVVQPRAYHNDGPVRRWVLPIEMLKEFQHELKEKIQETRKKDAPLVNGEWCRFCPALSVCPKVRAVVEATAIADFKNDIVELPAPENMPTEQLVRILKAIPLLDAWLKSVSGYALQQAQSGIKIPGYKLVKKRANRSWIDTDMVESLAGTYGDAIYKERTVKSPAQLEKIIGKSVVEPLCHKPDNGVTLVDEKDKRPEVTPQAIVDFSEVVDES